MGWIISQLLYELDRSKFVYMYVENSFYFKVAWNEMVKVRSDEWIIKSENYKSLFKFMHPYK